MYRRTTRTREIPFSFDSFLDVVANVVGIIIRLILVVWVSARSYESVQKYAALAAKPQADLGRKPSVAMPADKSERELQELQTRLAATLDRIGLLDREIEEDGQMQRQDQAQTAAVAQRRLA